MVAVWQVESMLNNTEPMGEGDVEKQDKVTSMSNSMILEQSLRSDDFQNNILENER